MNIYKIMALCLHFIGSSTNAGTDVDSSNDNMKFFFVILYRKFCGFVTKKRSSIKKNNQFKKIYFILIIEIKHFLLTGSGHSNDMESHDIESTKQEKSYCQQKYMLFM